MTDCCTARPSIAAFEAAELDAEVFDHEAHVYVGWLYLREYPQAEAIRRFAAALRRLTVKLGAEDKYHTTITWFFLLLIAKRRACASDDSWSTFRRENEDLFGRAAEVLGRYYSPALLASDEARRTFVLPDRLRGRAA